MYIGSTVANSPSTCSSGRCHSESDDETGDVNKPSLAAQSNGVQGSLRPSSNDPTA